MGAAGLCPQHHNPATAPGGTEAQLTSKSKVLHCGASVLQPTLGKGTNLAQQEHKDTNKLCPFVYSYLQSVKLFPKPRERCDGNVQNPRGGPGKARANKGTYLLQVPPHTLKQLWINLESSHMSLLRLLFNLTHYCRY